MILRSAQFILLLCLVSSCRTKVNKYEQITLFEKLSSDSTGIKFSNNLNFSKEFNIYTYRNFYNGGGVGLGDFNNDGLLDVYLTSNLQHNKLYINLGNWKFKDITESAGVGGTKAWSTGVAIADVNGDGWLDIYVCNSGDLKGDNKENELFINNGDLTFTESAAVYGLNDKGFTTHSAFFDFDNDGDLDAYILNNSYQAIGSFNLQKNERSTRDVLGGDKLMRNDNGRFVDVSERAGIYGSVIGFGLGVTVGDINKDGWIDIFVSNDFFERDYLYINQGDGSFKEALTEYMNCTSGASMGADMADLNNDGWLDLFVTEMLPFEHQRLKSVTTFEDWNRYQYGVSNDYFHQFTRNMLQVSNEGKNFSELGRLVGTEATDWSWGALMADFNNDGLKDIFVSNGIRQDLTNQDFLQYAGSEEFVKTVISNDGVNYEELVKVIPSEPVSNQAFINRGGVDFANSTKDWGLDHPSFSNGSAYGDLDNDGDLDLIVNNVDSEAFLYKNNANEMGNHYLQFQLKGEKMNTSAIGTKITVHTINKVLYLENMPTKGFESSVDPKLHLGLGKDTIVTSIHVQWPSGKSNLLRNVKSDQIVILDERNGLTKESLTESMEPSPYLTERPVGTMEFDKHEENNFNDFDRDRLKYVMHSNEGPAICTSDVNGDGLMDIYIGGAKEQSGILYIQQPDQKFQKGTTPFDKDKASEDCDCLFFDADSDGDTDLYVASGGYEFPNSSTALIDRLYINNGKGEFTKSNQILPAGKFESSSAVTAADFDNDGDNDLFVGIRFEPFRYGIPTNGYLLENNGSGTFTDVSLFKSPQLKDIGMITDAIWSDYDKDGDPDLLIVGEWMGIKVFENKDGQLNMANDFLGLINTEGWWNKIIAHDLDGDGDDDYVLGNHGLNSRFKADKDKPITMWVSDFDQNGTLEQIICRWWDDGLYPMALRHDLLSQLPSLKKKYLKYDSYKDQRIEDIFATEQLKQSLKLEAKELRTVVMWNENGKMQLSPLPTEAQYSPVYGLAAGDFTGDGYADIVVGGNQYRVKPEVGRYDASYGALFEGDGKGGFRFVKSKGSGLSIRGEVRNILPININNRKFLIWALNNERPKLFEITNQ
jgi:enediyne biosynthesis protein E4